VAAGTRVVDRIAASSRASDGGGNEADAELVCYFDWDDCLGPKSLGAGLFHSLKTEVKVGKGFVEGVMCIEDVDPAKDGTLVITRTATVETASLVIPGQLEWWDAPAI